MNFSSNGSEERVGGIEGRFVGVFIVGVKGGEGVGGVCGSGGVYRLKRGG